jgi:predicted HTH transcriptional regulator
MSKDNALVTIVEKTFSLPAKVIVAYAQLDPVFTSGDLARICDISRSSAKFYLNKMVELRMVTKVPHKRRYQKYANANIFSDWLKDVLKLAVIPLESGDLKVPEEE